MQRPDAFPSGQIANDEAGVAAAFAALRSSPTLDRLLERLAADGQTDTAAALLAAWQAGALPVPGDSLSDGRCDLVPDSLGLDCLNEALDAEAPWTQLQMDTDPQLGPVVREAALFCSKERAADCADDGAARDITGLRCLPGRSGAAGTARARMKLASHHVRAPDQCNAAF